MVAEFQNYMTDLSRPTHVRNAASPARQCPLCLSTGTLSTSHRRNSHETFLAVVAPFARPFRCSACNWRGMMGRIQFVRHRATNLWLNGLLFAALLILVLFLLANLRERLHPVSLLQPEFVVPGNHLSLPARDCFVGMTT